MNAFLIANAELDQADREAELIQQRARPNTRNAARLREHEKKKRRLTPPTADHGEDPPISNSPGREHDIQAEPPRRGDSREHPGRRKGKKRARQPTSQTDTRPNTRNARLIREHKRANGLKIAEHPGLLKAREFLDKNILRAKKRIKRTKEQRQAGVPEANIAKSSGEAGAEPQDRVNPYLTEDQKCHSVAELTTEEPRAILQDDEIAVDPEEDSEDMWKDLFPTEPSAAALALRPDLVFFDKHSDIPQLFRDRQRADSDLLRLTEKLTTTSCTAECQGRVHSQHCVRRWYEISDEGLLRRVVRERKPRTMNAEVLELRTRLRLHKCLCSWRMHEKTCPHRYHVLSEDSKVYRQSTVLIVPKTLIPSVLHHFHGAALSCHPGVTRTNSRIAQRFYWKNRYKHVSRWVNSCLRCRMRKTPRPQNVFPPGSIPLSTGPMQTLVLDFSGPFNTTARGNRYILGIMCPFAKWPICVPLPSRKASGVTRALLEHVIQHYSAPRFILTDNAQELIGREMQAFCKVFGITPLHTQPYTPQLNPFIERYHRVQAACLTILASKYKDDWDLALPLVTMVYRQTVNETTGFSPYQIMFAAEPRIGLDHVFGADAPPLTIPEHVSKMQRGLQETHAAVQQRHRQATLRNLDRRDAAFREVVYKPGDWVLLYSPKASEPLPKGMFRKKGLVDRWSPPAQVVSRGKQDGYYIVRDHMGNLQDVRTDSMISYRFYMDDLPALPPRPRFTKEERALLADDLTRFVPPEITAGNLVVFPMTMADGTPGFGVGKALEQLQDSSWDCQWFSNEQESLHDVFLPCWLNPLGRWYAGERQHQDAPLTTKNIYRGKITRRNVADVGFHLLPNHQLPNKVLIRIAQHDKFDWRPPLQDEDETELCPMVVATCKENPKETRMILYVPFPEHPTTQL